MFHQPLVLGPDRVSASDAYARRFSGDVGAWMLEVQTRTIEAFLADWAGGSVLDVGGGHAQITPHLLGQGWDVTTLVSSPQAGERLRRLTGDRAHCVVGNVEVLNLPENSFDVVIALRMMAHVADGERFLASLCRVARKGVVVDYPIAGGVNALSPLFFSVKKRFEGDTRPYASFRRRDIMRVFEKEGFRADRCVGEFVLPMILHRMLRRKGLSQGLETLLSPLAPAIGNPALIRASR